MFNDATVLKDMLFALKKKSELLSRPSLQGT